MMTEKVKCERCKGSGRLSKKDGGIHTLRSDKRRKPRCSYCHGDGYNMVGIKPAPALTSQDRKATT